MNKTENKVAITLLKETMERLKREKSEMSKTEKMPEVKRYFLRDYINENCNHPTSEMEECEIGSYVEYKDIESFCTQQAEKMEKLESIFESVYSMLEIYGVPRERAHRPDNGIMVLMTRIQKEINGYHYRIKNLEQENINLKNINNKEEKREAVELLNTIKIKLSDNFRESTAIDEQEKYEQEYLCLIPEIITRIDSFLSTQADKGAINE